MGWRAEDALLQGEDEKSFERVVPPRWVVIVKPETKLSFIKTELIIHSISDTYLIVG